MVHRSTHREARGHRQPGRSGRASRRWVAAWAFLVSSAWLAIGPARGADIAEAEGFFRSGRYEDAARIAAEEVRNGSWVERWHLLKVQAEMAQGLYPAALGSLEDGLRRIPGSISLLLLGREVYRYNGRQADADATLATIEARIQASPSRYATPEGRVALGRYYMARGADAKKVLDLYYDLAIKQRPELVEAYLATAELALAKQDSALAASTLEKAPKTAQADPSYHYLLARAFDDDDRGRSEKALDDALKINPRHTNSLLLRASHRIDQERYDEAADLIRQVFAINQKEPRAWAYQAVLAHLKSLPESEATARKQALAPWPGNPEVDHLIGRELSARYRFLEGSSAQRQALEIDPDYLPAKIQLCQDLLRLGLEDEGWKLAAEVFEQDGYNVLAYNLVTLRDRLSGFRTLKGDGFLVRMDPREAALYGDRVLALLGRARKTLGEKYGVAIADPVTVEIFPAKKEFAVRTFGLPGTEGFLGVCFGNVITANSPASQGETPSNWEAVLWHEYCHVVTLNKTRNKMPRWLSEGISVFEEATENPAWASALTPRYRAMLLGDDFTPLSRLSSAFLAPKSGMHLQFAYFESALAVEFLVAKAGLPTLREILDDLSLGLTINASLASRTHRTLDQLDTEFAAFARQKAEAAAPGLTFEEPRLPPGADSKAIEAWLARNPKSFHGLRKLAARYVSEANWPKARETIAKLKAAYPGYTGEDNADILLAAVCKKLGDPPGERSALEALASRDANAVPAYLRLMELEESSGDWKGLAADARRMLAVNPLTPAPHRSLARASEKLGQDGEALMSYRALALLDEIDPADTHYRLARLLSKLQQPVEARRETLKALEAAPRFLDAHKLLLELTEPAVPRSPTDSSPGGPAPR